MQSRPVKRLPATATGRATILIPLPPVLWQPIDGGCECSHCKGAPLLIPCWDTLAVYEQRPAHGGDYTSTVHAPELHSIVQRGDFASIRRAIALAEMGDVAARIHIQSRPHEEPATRISRIRVHTRETTTRSYPAISMVIGDLHLACDITNDRQIRIAATLAKENGLELQVSPELRSCVDTALGES